MFFKFGKFSKDSKPTLFNVKCINDVYFSNVVLWSSVNLSEVNIPSRINSSI